MKEDLSIFSIMDLEAFTESALNTIRIIKIKIAGIPESAIPVLDLIHLDNLETKIKRYKDEIDLRLGLTVEPGIKKARKKGPVKMFISYAHADEAVKDELIEHLSPLKQIGKLEYWDDRAIQLGDKWDEKIKKGLYEADIFLFLVSPKSLSSLYINSVELRIAFDKCRKNEAIFVPVIITSVLWQVLEIGEYQVAPKHGIPIDSNKWDSKNAAYLNVVKQLNNVLDIIIDKKAP